MERLYVFDIALQFSNFCPSIFIKHQAFWKYFENPQGAMLGYIVIDCSFTTSAFIVNIYNKFFLGTLPTLGNQLFESVSLIWRTLKMALPLAGRAKRRNGGSKLLAFLSKNALKEGPLFYNSFLLFSKGHLWKISKYLAVYTTHLVEKMIGQSWWLG